MSQIHTINRRRLRQLCAGVIPVMLMWVLSFTATYAQSTGIQINLAPLDGLAITPDNYLSFGLQFGYSSVREVEVRGNIHYRQSALTLSYKLRTVLRPGMNQLDAKSLRPEWQFSDNALRELFLNYHTLPQGTYEYCVTITPLGTSGETQTTEEGQECLYNRSEDLFLITLMEPEHDAKLYEHYPSFSWIVNYPFASQLTYRIRVAEVKEGQNVVNALARNNPVYTEGQLPQTTTTYPVYGTPLKVGQPYGWTVDAYYKGVLLGGAEPWKFTIVEDSDLKDVPRELSYYEFETHRGETRLYALGALKLKYISEEPSDSMYFRIVDAGGTNRRIQTDKLPVVLGDNRIQLPLSEEASLQHKKKYTLHIRTLSGKQFQVPFTYINPLFLN